MFLIGKEFDFSAGHQLDGLAAGHPCRRVHGHNYVVRVALAAHELDETGFVADFYRLAPLQHYIEDCIDHRFLNDVLPFAPTSELLAQHFYGWCAENLEVEVARLLHHTLVQESPTSWAAFSPTSVPLPHPTAA